MKLQPFPSIGQGHHRSGWTDVLKALQGVADGTGLLLDDCIERTLLFGPTPRRAIAEPFVGIFHFPHDVRSPCNLDLERNSAFTLANSPLFQRSQQHLRGGIALCETLARWWERRTGVPFLALKHPTETNVPMWSYEDFARQPTVLQLGFHLRNTRAIYQLPPRNGWRYARIEFYQDYQKQRDAHLASVLPDKNQQVEEWRRLPDMFYDHAMARSVVLSEAFGVAACNVIIESIARGTPVIVERRAETEEYLGAEYCLYLNEYGDLDEETLRRAHEQLCSRRGRWLDVDYFASQVKEFVDKL